MIEARGYVDTGPVVERALATAAGLGWTGKNTCLIHPKLGSFGFLAVLLTSLEVEEEAGGAACRTAAGAARRCLEACPTGALIAPYQMDATRCISYLTIEHRGAIAAELMEGMGRQVFGCDICQDVCPWNRKAPMQRGCGAGGADGAGESGAGVAGGDGLRRSSSGNSMDRRCDGPGSWGLRRNVAIAMGNSGRAEFRATAGGVGGGCG